MDFEKVIDLSSLENYDEDELQSEWDAIQFGVDAASTLMDFCENSPEFLAVESMFDKLCDYQNTIENCIMELVDA